MQIFVVVCLCFVDQANGIEPKFALDIPATTVETAIKELAKQTGYLTLFQSDDVVLINTNAIEGQFTLREALISLLKNTTLTYDLTEGGVITVSLAPSNNSIRGETTMDLNPATQSQPLLFSRFVATLAAVVIAAPAPGEAVEEEVYMEEIIVTAEIREENILRVPITMSAFNEKMIEELGITNALDLEQLVPGLQFGSASLQQRSDGQGITIRGIGTQSARELHSDLAVAVYVDGVYTVDTYGLAPNLFDIERVEVARGPQGTLNGRNSIAGSISFYSKRPTDTWDTEVLAEFTDQTTQRYNVAFGGPITDSISFRINGGVFDGDGAQENTGIGKDVDAPDETTFSPQLRFKNDRFDINLKYLNVRDQGSEAFLVRFADIARNNPDQGNWFLNDRPMPSLTSCSNPPITGLPGTSIFATTPVTAKIICNDLENKVASNRDGIQDSETDRYTLNFDWHITDALTLRYTYGKSETQTTSSQDGDGNDRVGSAADPSIPADLDASAQVDCFDDGVLMGEVDCWTAQGATFSDTDTVHAFTNDESSHELQLVSNFDGPLNFVVGIYTYENETFFDQGGFDYANPLRFVDADEAAVAASPIFGETVVTSCRSYLDDFFIPQFGDPATGIVFGNFGVGCPQGNDNLRSSSFFSSTTSDTKAAFANVEYQINDEWNIAGGIRWTEDEKRRTAVIPADLVAVAGEVVEGTVANSIFVGDFFGTGVPVVFTGSAGPPTPTTWDKVIGHVSVEYTPEEELMYYGRISTGYRAGGFNWEFLDNKDSFDEEELINYEFGVKGLFLDKRLRLTTGLFYQDFENYQLTANQPVDPIYIDPTDNTFLREHTINVGSSTKIWGFEVEGVYYVTDRWRISGFYNYLGSELGRHSTVVRDDPDQTFVDYTFRNPAADPAGPDGVIGTADDFLDTNQVPLPRDHTGDELPQMPNHKLALTVAYTLPLDQMGSLQFLGTYSYTGERWPQRAGNISRTKVPSYDRFDLRVKWDSADGQWSATLYVQNALDDIGVSESISIDLQGSLTEPRQVGLVLRWRPEF